MRKRTRETLKAIAVGLVVGCVISLFISVWIDGLFGTQLLVVCGLGVMVVNIILNSYPERWWE